MTAYVRLGRYQDALEDPDLPHASAVISDPPYSRRNHEGVSGQRIDGADPTVLTYAHWTPGDVREFVEFWAPRNRGWFACMTSHDLCPAYEDAYRDADLTTFAPIPCVMRGMSCRMAGDGPSSWAVWLCVARPKSLARWGTLPGAYVGSPNRGGYAGGKPQWLMDAIVRDYSRKGDLVVDPCAGMGTTLVAAISNGRSALGAEVNPEAHAKAQARLRGGVTLDMFGGEAA